jgi:DNA mismatch repair protein MutL
MEAFDNRRIEELPKQIYDKIAAGEVVDRPLSIVKELVENSIDAGATAIVIEIRNGGKTYLRVTDNGCGIEKSDVELAFKRHATSKIRKVEDLDHIESLGFRGEALASISAVSRVELITKTAQEKSGIRIKIEGGEILEKEETGCPDGTTILVEDLFFNTPARMKFMKPDATESTLIIDFISKMTLAYPKIKIRLINNGNILFSTPGKGDIYSNILTIYSKETGEKLLHIERKDGDLALEAFVSAPSNSKTNRKSQIFFVNGRSISSKVMDQAVTDAYQEKLFEGRYPIAFLFLRVDPEKLDVNIHPNKKEVRFDDERRIREFLAQAIREGLKSKDAIPEIREKSIFRIPAADPQDKLDKTVTQKKIQEQVDIKKLLSEQRQKEQDQNAAVQIPEPVQEKKTWPTEAIETLKVERDDAIKQAVVVDPVAVIEPAVVNETMAGYQRTSIDLATDEKLSSMDFDIRTLTVTGSVFGTYITAVDENNLYLIDQHAAHERIFYEQLLDQYRAQEKPQQMILTPLVVNVTHAVKNDAGGMLDFLGNMGFDIEEFGPTAYIVKAVPAFMDLGEAKDFIDFLLDNISDEAELENQKKIAKIITNACKKAVKAHDVLDRHEIERLMTDLAKTRNPYSCPHGRPTFVRLSQYEIEKMFKRV